MESCVKIDSNIPNSILNKLQLNLHLKENHPIGIVYNLCKFFFAKYGYIILESNLTNLNSRVTNKEQFDDLLKRKLYSDNTFDFHDKTMLRCNMLAHLRKVINVNIPKMLLTGDVYNNVESNIKSYPISYQTIGICLDDNYDKMKDELVPILTKFVSYIFPNEKVSTNKNSIQIGNKKMINIIEYKQINKEVFYNLKVNDQLKSGIIFEINLDIITKKIFKIRDIRDLYDYDNSNLKFEHFKQCEVIDIFNESNYINQLPKLKKTGKNLIIREVKFELDNDEISNSNFISMNVKLDSELCSIANLIFTNPINKNEINFSVTGIHYNKKFEKCSFLFQFILKQEYYVNKSKKNLKKIDKKIDLFIEEVLLLKDNFKYNHIKTYKHN